MAMRLRPSFTSLRLTESCSSFGRRGSNNASAALRLGRPVPLRLVHDRHVLGEEHLGQQRSQRLRPRPRRIGERFENDNRDSGVKSPLRISSKARRNRQPYLLVVVTFATGKSIFPVPPPTSTLICTEVRLPRLQPWAAHAAKWSLTVIVPHVRAVFRVLIICVQGPECPLSQALAPPVPVVCTVFK